MTIAYDRTLPQTPHAGDGEGTDRRAIVARVEWPCSFCQLALRGRRHETEDPTVFTTCHAGGRNQKAYSRLGTLRADR
jgi:hypothetical protein